MKVGVIAFVLLIAAVAAPARAEHLRNKNKAGLGETIVLPLTKKPLQDLTKVNAIYSLTKPVVNMCAQGKDSKKILHFRTDAARETFHIRLNDKLTGSLLVDRP